MYCIEKNAFNELSFIIIFSSSLISEHVQRYPGSLTYDGEGKQKMFLFENMFLSKIFMKKVTSAFLREMSYRDYH